MAFLTEPARDLPLQVIPGIRRIVAANPGPLTGHGTNTYLLESTDGAVVIDPGPPGAPTGCCCRATVRRSSNPAPSSRNFWHIGGSRKHGSPPPSPPSPARRRRWWTCSTIPSLRRSAPSGNPLCWRTC